jgi:hypothetical protein
MKLCRNAHNLGWVIMDDARTLLRTSLAILSFVSVCCFSTAFALSFAAHPAAALEITVDAYDSGWILPSEYHITSNENYAAGFSEINAYYYRNFFRFDLTALSAPVSSAILRIHLGTYNSQDPSETYQVFDAPVLQFAYLGSGTSYGSREIFAAETGIVDIVLNAAAIADINAALGGLFDVGGAVTSLAASPTTSELLFGNTNQFSTRQLILNPVPEPTTMLLVGVGLLALGIRRRS